MSANYNKLDTKAFELVFSLTIVVWLLDLSKSLPPILEFIGWFITLGMVILFCLNAQLIKEIEQRNEDKPFISAAHDNFKNEIEKHLRYGIIVITIFLVIIVLARWNNIENLDSSIFPKFLVLYFAWIISATLDHILM